MALSDEEKREIARIMREEMPEKYHKPAFPYRKHLYWAVMTAGLSVPIWIFMSLRHDYRWRKKTKSDQL